MRGGIALAVALALAGCAGPTRFEVTRVWEGDRAVVRLRVDRDEINVAQTVLVVLEADVRAGVTPSLPKSFAESGPQGLTIQDTGEEKPRSVSRGVTRFARWFRLEPFLSGEYVVPSFAVEIVDAVGNRATVRTEPVPLQVTSLLPRDYERMDIRDITGVLRPPWRPPPGLLAIAVVLMAAALGTAVWLWIQKRARDRYVRPPRPAHEIAYEELGALVAQRLVESGEIKLFYQRVTDILRRYVERRFGLRAPEHTTEEFLGELKDTDVLSDDLKKLLRLFLEHADLVKFAQLRPLDDQIEGTLSSCRDFVRATQIVEPEAAGAV